MSGRIVIIRPDRVREIIARGYEVTLNEVQRLVGDGTNVTVQMLEGCYDAEPAQFLFDEEGNQKNLATNFAATHLFKAQEHTILMGPRGLTGILVVLQGEARWV